MNYVNDLIKFAKIFRVEYESLSDNQWAVIEAEFPSLTALGFAFEGILEVSSLRTPEKNQAYVFRIVYRSSCASIEPLSMLDIDSLPREYRIIAPR